MRLRYLATAAVSAALLVPAAAPAAEQQPRAKCTFKAKKKYRLRAVLKRGLTVKVTCDGPAKVDTMFDFVHGTKQEDKWSLSHSGGIPGISRGPSKTLKGPGTVVLRNRFTREAARFVKRYRRTKLDLYYGREHPTRDNAFKSVGGKTVVVVR